MIEVRDVFQSHNGAIAAGSDVCYCSALRKVSIPQWCDCCQTCTNLRKPAQTVSIPQWCDCCSIILIHSFPNASVSIPQWCDCCPFFEKPLFWKFKFQSHNGAIAAHKRLWAGDEICQVSIPQWCDCCCDRRKYSPKALSGFNPTMVRLLLVRQVIANGGWQEFQSHNGAIAARKWHYNVGSHLAVSIPQWCDCCHTYHPPD